MEFIYLCTAVFGKTETSAYKWKVNRSTFGRCRFVRNGSRRRTQNNQLYRPCHHGKKHCQRQMGTVPNGS